MRRPWPPLAPSTLREKTRLGFPLVPLVRTGALEKSLTDRQVAARITPQSMSWGTDVPYAKYHQGYRDDSGARGRRSVHHRGHHRGWYGV